VAANAIAVHDLEWTSSIVASTEQRMAAPSIAGQLQRTLTKINRSRVGDEAQLPLSARARAVAY